MSGHSTEIGAARPGRPEGGLKSEMGKAAYWRMNYESAIQALADLIAENTENVEFARDFYAHNADLLSDHWRAEFARVFPSGVDQ